MTKTYRVNFIKSVNGWIEVNAENETDAEEKINSGDFDEFENKSDFILSRNEKEKLDFYF